MKSTVDYRLLTTMTSGSPACLGPCSVARFDFRRSLPLMIPLSVCHGQLSPFLGYNSFASSSPRHRCSLPRHYLAASPSRRRCQPLTSSSLERSFTSHLRLLVPTPSRGHCSVAPPSNHLRMSCLSHRLRGHLLLLGLSPWTRSGQGRRLVASPSLRRLKSSSRVAHHQRAVSTWFPASANSRRSSPRRRRLWVWPLPMVDCCRLLVRSAASYGHLSVALCHHLPGSSHRPRTHHQLLVLSMLSRDGHRRRSTVSSPFCRRRPPAVSHRLHDHHRSLSPSASWSSSYSPHLFASQSLSSRTGRSRSWLPPLGSVRCALVSPPSFTRVVSCRRRCPGQPLNIDLGSAQLRLRHSHRVAPSHYRPRSSASVLSPSGVDVLGPLPLPPWLVLLSPWPPTPHYPPPFALSLYRCCGQLLVSSSVAPPSSLPSSHPRTRVMSSPSSFKFTPRSGCLLRRARPVSPLSSSPSPRSCHSVMVSGPVVTMWYRHSSSYPARFSWSSHRQSSVSSALLTASSSGAVSGRPFAVNLSLPLPRSFGSHRIAVIPQDNRHSRRDHNRASPAQGHLDDNGLRHLRTLSARRNASVLRHHHYLQSSVGGCLGLLTSCWLPCCHCNVVSLLPPPFPRFCSVVAFSPHCPRSNALSPHRCCARLMVLPSVVDSLRRTRPSY